MFNNSNLYGSEWLALVFNNRNQNYGAYVLRAQSSFILLKSLAMVAPVFVMLFVGPSIYASLKGDDTAPVERKIEVNLADRIHQLKKPKAKEEPVKKEPAKASPPAAQQQVQTKQFNNVVVVEETESEPVTTAELQKSAIGSTTQTGVEAGGNTLPSGTGTGEGTGTAQSGSGTDEILEYGGVDQFPEFPGGMEAWSKFIQKNLRYPYAAQDASIQGKVYVSFVVEKDGSITDVHVVRGIGYGCDDEAMRVIKKSPKWKAGMQNKQAVRVRYNMPINYVLSN